MKRKKEGERKGKEVAKAQKKEVVNLIFNKFCRI